MERVFLRSNRGNCCAYRLPFPSNLADRARARKAREGLIRQVDEFVPGKPSDLTAMGSVDDLLRRIDRLTYEYFGLNEDEITLVEETAEDIFPAIQPSRNAFPQLWMAARYEDRRTYADALMSRLAGWFVGADAPSVRLIARNEDFSIIELSIESGRGVHQYREDNQEGFSIALTKLAKHLDQPVAGNFLLTPDVRVFAGKKLYLIKPLQRRFWLPFLRLCRR